MANVSASRIVLVLFISLIASSARAITASSQQQTLNNQCLTSLTRTGLPIYGNITVEWKTRDDLSTGLVSRTWNYFMRIGSCQSNQTNSCKKLVDSGYVPGANIMDGRVNLKLTVPIENLGCIISRNPFHQGIGIILAASGYVYNSYTTLHFIDFAHLRNAPVEFEHANAGTFTVTLQ